jgi:hypothetical protein
MISCSVVSQLCPKCNLPVTFGGGITIVNGSLDLSPAVKKPPFNQKSYLPCSTSLISEL